MLRKVDLRGSNPARGCGGQRERAVRLPRRLRRIAAGVLWLAAPALLTSCYGRFPLTKAVYRYNGQVGASASDATQRGILQSLVMWAFVIIPVYGVALLADALIINLIEFWTGDTLQIGRVDAPDGSRLVLTPAGNAREAVLTIERDGAVLAQRRVIRESPDRLAITTLDGRPVGALARTASGAIRLEDAAGHPLAMMPADPID